MKYLLILLVPFIVACQERYRYPCQDPDNWDNQMCKKPYCSANGTCPEDLRHYEKNVPLQTNNTIGRCS
jgi:hypothetical protein